MVLLLVEIVIEAVVLKKNREGKVALNNTSGYKVLRQGRDFQFRSGVCLSEQWGDILPIYFSAFS